ncbi:unnamed protein product [Chrysoparadoxa australica]
MSVSGSSSRRDIFEKRPEVNGLWAQPLPARRERENHPRNEDVGFDAGERPFDVLLTVKEELAAKDEILDRLNKKMIRMEEKHERNQTAIMELEEEKAEMMKQVAWEREVREKAEKDVKRLGSEVAANERRVRELRKAAETPSHIIRRLGEEEKLRREAEAALRTEKKIVRDWLEESGRSALEGDLSASLLVDELSLMGQALEAKDVQIEDLLQGRDELAKELKHYQGMQQGTEEAQQRAEHRWEAAKAKFRATSAQNERLNAEVRDLQQTLEALTRREEERERASEQRKGRARRDAAARQADIRHREDAIRSLEDQLRKARSDAVEREEAARSRTNASVFTLLYHFPQLRDEAFVKFDLTVVFLVS